MSPLHLSVASFWMFLPLIIIAPFAGVLSDTLNRKIILLIANGLQVLTSIIFIILYAMGIFEFGILLLLLIIGSISQAFNQPTFFAIVPSMVSQKHLGRINGFTYFVTNLIQSFGPIYASFILAYFSFIQGFWVLFIVIAIAFIPLILIKIPQIK